MNGNELPQFELLAVGDLMMGCAYFHTLVNESIPDKLSRNEPLVRDEVVETLRGADLLFGNLECVVSDEFEKSDGTVPPRLMAPPEAIRVLDRCGFDVLNLANNHILDHGPEYVEETVKRLDYHEIQHVGDPLEKPHEVRIEWGDNEIQVAGFYVPDLSSEQTKDDIRSFVETTRDTADLTIVSLHWGLGYEHMHRPAPEQVEFGRELVDLGAKIVLGHHSHTFQPVEQYRDGVIAYSLGNFIFDMWRRENRSSGILKLAIDPDMTVHPTVIPTKQVGYEVGFTDDKFIRETLTMPVESESADQYRKAAKTVRRNHRLEVIKKYVENSHKFPIEFHIRTWKRWANKALSERFQ